MAQVAATFLTILYVWMVLTALVVLTKPLRTAEEAAWMVPTAHLVVSLASSVLLETVVLTRVPIMRNTVLWVGQALGVAASSGTVEYHMSVPRGIECPPDA